MNVTLRFVKTDCDTFALRALFCKLIETFGKGPQLVNGSFRDLTEAAWEKALLTPRHSVNAFSETRQNREWDEEEVRKR